jgi:hypothetical protein
LSSIWCLFDEKYRTFIPSNVGIILSFKQIFCSANEAMGIENLSENPVQISCQSLLKKMHSGGVNDILNG